MQINFSNLEKQAVDAALKGQWNEAINLNLQILEQNPADLNAQIRLGRAYLQSHEFNKATKIFQDVLKIDPINQIAKKNLVLSKEKKVEKGKEVSIKAKALIKEPGTATEAHFELGNKRLDASKFVPGEEFELKIKKDSVDVYCEGKFVGTIIDKYLISDLNNAKEAKKHLRVTFVRIRGTRLAILIKSPTPIFRADKQDVRPYFKKGTIEEPELEMEDEVEEADYNEE